MWYQFMHSKRINRPHSPGMCWSTLGEQILSNPGKTPRNFCALGRMQPTAYKSSQISKALLHMRKLTQLC